MKIKRKKEMRIDRQEIQKQKVKNLLRKIHDNKFYITQLLLALIILSNCKNEKIPNNNNNICCRSVYDSLDIFIERFYTYNIDRDTCLLVAERYQHKNELFLVVSYHNEHIKSFKNYDTSLTNAYMPFLDNRLPFDLFQTNCGNCHQYYPSSQPDKFKNLILTKYELKELNAFLKDGEILNSDVHFSHPKFTKLDSVEIKYILDFILKEDEGNIRTD